MLLTNFLFIHNSVHLTHWISLHNYFLFFMLLCKIVFSLLGLNTVYI